MIIFNTQQDWVKAMKQCAKYNTSYRNQYPYNLLFYTGSLLIADCVNFQKALFNGRNVYSMGANTYQSNLSNTGDVNEIGLLNQCDNVSADFTKLKANEPRILWMDGHIGAYIGEEVTLNGNIYNVIEWTAWTGDFGHQGCIYSYVDSYGRRLNHKGGYQSGTWLKHGLPTRYVNYVYEPVWVQKWHLYDHNGKMLTGWQYVKSKWYYLDKNGIMLTGWVKDGGKWYLLSSNGDMLTGWQKVKDKWYYLTPKNDGTHKTGEMWTGWLKDNGKWYYLDSKDGYMYVGTHIIDGKTYTFNSKGELIS